MRHRLTFAPAIGSLFIASSSFASFTFSTQMTNFVGAAGNRTFVDVFAQNDVGGEDGNAIQAIELNYIGAAVGFYKPGSEVNFANDFSGNAALPPGFGAEYGFIRNVGVFPSAGQTPALTSDEWSSVTQFSVIAGVVGTAANANNPIPILRLSYPAGVQPAGVISGFIRGEVGEKVPIRYPPEPPTSPPIIAENSGATVVFGSIVSEPLPFSGTVVILGPNTGDTFALLLGTLPANVSGVTVTPSGQNPSGTVFTISGLISYIGNGDTIIPIIASDDNALSADTDGAFIVTVTPEPASLSALALSGLLASRRRRDVVSATV